MRIEFNQGVPTGCIEWLWKNIGQGNIYPGGLRHAFASCEADQWKYERITKLIKSDDPKYFSSESHVPTITVYDEKKAVLFALRWL